MRAVGLYEYGGPDVLRVVEVPTPHAGPGEVRIRVHAATVNPTDVLLREGDADGALRDVSPPYIPGMDVAGVVDEVGEDADTELRPGDRAIAMVLPFRPAGGGYAEHVVLPADWVVRAPAGATHAEAATLPMNGLTARMALDLLALPPGARLAVTGGAGALGGYVIGLADAEGLVVLADAGPADERLVQDLGAHVVVARGEGLAERLRDAVPGGVDAVVDAALVGPPVLAALRDGGALARIRGDGERGVQPMAPERGIGFRQVQVPRYAGNRARLAALSRQAETGVLRLRVGQTHAPEAAAEAHRRLEAGGSRGRHVITFSREE